MNLVRGQRAKLSDLTAASKVEIHVELEGPSSADVVCLALLLGEKHEAVEGNAVITEEVGRSDCGGLAARPRSGLTQVFELDASRLASSIESILFAIALLGKRGEPGSASSIKVAKWRLVEGGKVLAGFELEGRELGSDAGITMGEIYRKSGVLRLRALGEGFAGGLPSMLSRFKVAPSLIPGTGGARGGPGLRVAASGVWLPKTWPGDRTPAVPKDLTRAVGLVVTKNAEGSVHTGTGFVVTPGGHFVTCHHVVEDAVDLAIALDGSGVLRKAEVVGADAESDLALCWISDGNGSPDWQRLAGADTDPGLGDELGLLGYPLGVDLGISVTYSQGIINSLRKRGETAVLQIDVGAAPGSSGGPVFRRKDGAVVGVLTSGLDIQKGMHINFAADIRAIFRLGWIR
ncbi:MAG: trypsin-like peptidase domain-containing protein [Deltaproteobacteria bacterium]|nr:trypsin-like peptidase domain-containing protein [Deltaproteobacteria bacterium]